ncbi:MAG: lactonase family protein [Terracidiphilus sp.]|nr:lactonase family protein [Terracidiphilus sp.]
MFKPEMVTRRQFVAGASAVALAPVLAAETAREPRRVRAYVGTYTGSAGNGEGIYVYDYEPESGTLHNRRVAARTPSPSWIAVHPSQNLLYTVNEVADFAGSNGSVSAFAIEPESGLLRELNKVSSEGAGPAHLSLDATGKFALVANYGGGSIAVLPIEDSGLLGRAVEVRRNEGNVGATEASNAPAGSFAISGHDAPHAHMIATSPDNKFALATDLGQDRIYIYGFDAASGKFAPPYHGRFASLPTGDGPRHFAFHPNGKWLYSLQEEASTVVCFRWEAERGMLHEQQTVSALPPGFAGTSFASEILVAADGRTLYAANRLHDTIAVFGISGDGLLERRGETATGGDYPVQCRIDPAGRFFFACNRRSDAITSFRIEPGTGALRATGQYMGVGSPASITFVSVD